MKFETAKARAKYNEYMRAQGTPMRITAVEAQQLRTLLGELYDRGMSYRGIADSAPGGHYDTTVSKILNHHMRAIHRDVYNDLIQAQFVQPVGHKKGRHVDPTGMQRRIRALVADGFGYSHTLGPMLGTSLQAVQQLATADRPALAGKAAEVAALYEKLEGADPADHGGTTYSIGRAKGLGIRMGWAPTHCWDPGVGPDDEGYTFAGAIDDPDGYPDWTGECGTVNGYFLHLRHGIRVDVHDGGLNAHGKPRRRGNRRVRCPACLAARRTLRARSREDGRAYDYDAIWLALQEQHTAHAVADMFGCHVRTVERVKTIMKGSDSSVESSNGQSIDIGAAEMQDDTNTSIRTGVGA